METDGEETAASPNAQACDPPAAAGWPSSVQTMKNGPGPAKMRTSVETLTATVARAKRSSPDSPGAEDDVLGRGARRPGDHVAHRRRRLASDQGPHNERPGVSTEYAAARTIRMRSAMTSMSTTVAGAIDLIDSPTLSNSVTFGMIARKSRTTRAPERARAQHLEEAPSRAPDAPRRLRRKRGVRGGWF